MVKVALASALVAAGFLAAPAIAHPLVIASLSVDTLLPAPIASDRALAHAYDAHRARFDDAARELGFSASERTVVDRAFASGRARSVDVPRHLDAMSEYRDGRVQVLHDVVIPANEHGYAVSVQEPHDVLTAYIPSVCGNLSYVRTPRRYVAAARMTPAPRVAAAVVPPPAPAAPAPPSYAAPAPSYAVPVAVAVPVPVPAPVPVYAPSYAIRVYAAPRYVIAPRYVPVRRYVAVRRYVPVPGYVAVRRFVPVRGYVARSSYVVGRRYAVRDRVFGYAPRSFARYDWSARYARGSFAHSAPRSYRGGGRR